MSLNNTSLVIHIFHDIIWQTGKKSGAENDHSIYSNAVIRPVLYVVAGEDAHQGASMTCAPKKTFCRIVLYGALY